MLDAARRHPVLAALLLLLAAPGAPDATATQGPAITRPLASGHFHTCGIRPSGSATCWGYEGHGAWSIDPPAGTFTAVAAGYSHSCALDTTKAIQCWGWDGRDSLRAPSGAFDDLAVGIFTACAIRHTDRGIDCWGQGVFGEGSHAPSGAFKAIAAGSFYFCGIDDDDELRCWGTYHNAPLNPPAGKFKAVAAGNIHACAIRTSGDIACWGAGEHGETSPPAGSYRSIGAGNGHSCAVKTDGAVVCWGNPKDGRTDAPAGNFSIVTATGWAEHTCGLRKDGTATCWGTNTFGQSSAPGGAFGTVYVADFDWEMPERFSDLDRDGRIDYFPPDGALEIKPPKGWRAKLHDKSEAACNATNLRTWLIDGEPVEADDPEVDRFDPHSCTLEYRFPEEGTYEVTLEIWAGGELLGTKTRDVVIQDWLIVSLGDSIASGEGNPEGRGVGLGNWRSRQCHRTAFAGPALAAALLEQIDPRTSVTFIHLACSGASMDQGVLGSYVGQEPGPLLAPQVEDMIRLAAGREIDALALSIGGNDVEFSDLLVKCMLVARCDEPGYFGARDDFEALAALLPAKYDAVAHAMEIYEIPADRVIATEYSDPTRGPGGAFSDGCVLGDHPAATGGFLGIEEEEAEWASLGLLARLNSELAGAAARNGWRYMTGPYAGTRDNGYCANEPFVVTYRDSTNRQGDNYGTVHPNFFGHLLYSDLISAELLGSLYDGGDLERPRPPRDAP